MWPAGHVGDGLKLHPGIPYTGLTTPELPHIVNADLLQIIVIFFNLLKPYERLLAYPDTFLSSPSIYPNNGN